MNKDVPDLVNDFVKRNYRLTRAQTFVEEEMPTQFVEKLGKKAVEAVDYIKEKLYPYTQLKELMDHKRKYEEEYIGTKHSQAQFDILKTRTLECPLTIPVPDD